MPRLEAGLGEETESDGLRALLRPVSLGSGSGLGLAVGDKDTGTVLAFLCFGPKTVTQTFSLIHPLIPQMEY